VRSTGFGLIGQDASYAIDDHIPNSKLRSMDRFKVALIKLTNRIEFIMNKHPICEDTGVRDRICDILQKSLIAGNANQRPHWFYGAFNPIAEVRIWRALSTFLRDPAVTQFIKDHDDNRRLELIKAMIADGSAVSATGQTLDDHLGEWA